MRSLVYAILLGFVCFTLVESAPAPFPRKGKFTLEHKQVIVGGNHMNKAVFSKGEVKMTFYADHWMMWAVTYSGTYSVRGKTLFVNMKKDAREGTGEEESDYKIYKGNLTTDPNQVIELELVPEELPPPKEEN